MVLASGAAAGWAAAGCCCQSCRVRMWSLQVIGGCWFRVPRESLVFARVDVGAWCFCGVLAALWSLVACAILL